MLNTPKWWGTSHLPRFLIWYLVVELLSRAGLFAIPWTAACQASLSFTISQSLLTHAYWVGDAIQPSHPPSSPSPPTFSLSQHKSLFSESVLRIRWPKYWSFSFNISLSNEYSGLISFRMDWLDLWRIFSNTTVQKQQFLSARVSLWSKSHIHTWLLEKT